MKKPPSCFGASLPTLALGLVLFFARSGIAQSDHSALGVSISAGVLTSPGLLTGGEIYYHPPGKLQFSVGAYYWMMVASQTYPGGEDYMARTVSDNIYALSFPFRLELAIDTGYFISIGPSWDRTLSVTTDDTTPWNLFYFRNNASLRLGFQYVSKAFVAELALVAPMENGYRVGFGANSGWFTPATAHLSFGFLLWPIKW